MRFDQYVWKNRVIEWKHYYINFGVLSKLLKTSRLLRVTLESNQLDGATTGDGAGSRTLSQQVDPLFIDSLKDQIALFDDFIHYKFDIQLKRQFVILDYNLRMFDIKKMDSLKAKKARQLLKTALMKYFKELCLFKGYINLNEKIYMRLTEMYKKTLLGFDAYDEEKGKMLNEVFRSTRIVQISKKVEKLVRLIGNTILTNFYRKRDFQKGQEDLKKLESNSQLTKQQASSVGFYIGVCLMCFIVAILLIIETDFFSEEQSDFIRYQFPVFRGSLLCFIYILLLGVTVYILEKNNMNYKKVFNIQLINFNAYEIMATGFSFLAIWMLVFLYCGISFYQKMLAKGYFFNENIAPYFPPVLWIVFFGFVFFPSRHLLKGKARLFLLSVCADVIIGLFRDITPLTGFALNQLLSSTTSLKDFTYTVCYCVNLISTGSDVNTCDVFPFRIVIFCVTVIPLLYKFVFTIRKAFKIYSHRNYSNSYTSDMRRQMINILKNIISITTSFMSFFSQLHSPLLTVWIVLSIINAIYSYLWDIIVEWGFMSNTIGLRDIRAFRQTWIYYLAMVLNLGFRYSWTLSISPTLFTSNRTRSIVTTSVALVELIRRMIWNIFKIECEHVKFIGKFKSMTEDDLPFPLSLNMRDPVVNKLVNYQFKQYLNLTFVNTNLEEVNSTLEQIYLKLNLVEKNKEGGEPLKNLTFISKLSNQEYYFVDEKDEESGLKLYERSLEHCRQFVKSMEYRINLAKPKRVLCFANDAKQKKHGKVLEEKDPDNETDQPLNMFISQMATSRFRDERQSIDLEEFPTNESKTETFQ
jgi:hypothetical protein